MQVADFATSSIQLRLKILNRRPSAPRRRPPPSFGGGQKIPPSVEQAFVETKFLGDDSSRLTAR
ncbi:MAG: hypothetical protein RIS76_4148 [Verrucomicrobiota bacterium]